MSRMEMGQGWPFDREVAVATLERLDAVLGALTQISTGVWNLPMRKNAKQARKWDPLHVPRPDDPDDPEPVGVWVSIPDMEQMVRSGALKGEVK